jgi:outer membrane protein
LGGNSIFQNRANYVQQKVSYLNSQILKKNTEIQVKTDVSRAHQNLKLIKRTYTVTLSQLEAAEKAFSFESERYNLGITNFVDFANANRVFVQAQTDKAQAEYRLLFQKIAIDYATGTLKTDNFE